MFIHASNKFVRKMAGNGFAQSCSE